MIKAMKKWVRLHTFDPSADSTVLESHAQGHLCMINHCYM
uniref:Uncharacterized protein n=1 Tax=Rhizophora mucronata TaxID=61149 RepID=A0A2P2PNM3_RHIMU